MIRLVQDTMKSAKNQIRTRLFNKFNHAFLRHKRIISMLINFRIITLTGGTRS